MMEKRQLLATVPWISIISNPDLTLENSAFFKDVKCQNDTRRVSMFKGFNKCFPIYIPLCHHEMCVKDLVEKRPNGKYWAEAIHFLISNKGFNSFAWKVFQERFDGKNPENSPLKDLIICDNLIDAYSQDEIEPQGQEAARYLLSPWVLMQLPFQPVLFQQWLVACTVEVYRFNMACSELCCFPLSNEHEKTISSIFWLLRGLLIFVYNGFNFLQEYTEAENKATNIKIPNIGYGMHLLGILLENDMMEVIRSVKRLVWASPQVGPVKPLEIDQSFDLLNNIFSLNFWINVMPHQKMFFDRKNAYSLLIKEDLKNENVDFDDLLEILQAYCHHELDFSDNLKAFLKKDEKFMRALLNLRRSEKNSSLLKVRKEDNGIIGMVVNMAIYNHSLESADHAKRRLIEVTGIHPRKMLRENYDDLPDEKIALDFFAKNLLEYNKQGQLFDLVQSMEEGLKLKFVCQPSKKCPRFDDEPGAIAAVFEARIVQLVFDRMRKQYKKTLKGGIVFYSDPGLNDWFFPQYILPCFVASLLERFSAKDKPASDDFKKWYVKVVHSLISAYEKTNHDSIEELEASYSALYFQKQFSTPLLLRAFFRSTIDDFLSSLFHTGEFSYFSDCIGKLMINKALVPSVQTLNLSQNVCFDALAFDFFLKFRVALRKNCFHVYRALRSQYYPVNLHELIQTLCCVGFHNTEGFSPGDFRVLLPTSTLLLTIVNYILIRNSKDDISSTRRLSKRLKSLDESLLYVAKDETKNLSETQMQFLAFYLTLKFVPRENFKKLLKIKTTICPLGLAISSFMTDGNMWLLKHYLNVKRLKETRVSLEFAKEKAPVLYYVAMNELNKHGNKYKIKDRADSWFFPIVHCRNCGALEDVVHRCDLCTTSSCYPDQHFYCSDSCKNRALKLFHNREHIEHQKYFL